jgi:pilus assembly protein CpaF
MKHTGEEMNRIFQDLYRKLMQRLAGVGELSDEEIGDLIDDLLLENEYDYLSEESVRDILNLEERSVMRSMLFSAVRKLDIIQPLVEDDQVTEIMVNGPASIYYEKNGKIWIWNHNFSSAEKLDDVIQKIVGSCNRVINASQPIADARLKDGSRVNAVIAPVALNGPILTIRKFPKESITMKKLIEWGTISVEAAEFLKKLVRCGYSIVIGGGTSAGKTTFLNALSEFIPSQERIITIEDNAELQIRGISNLVRLEAKKANLEEAAEITIRDLIRSALRMRPDRIIVGEVRGGEALDMLQAFNTGHDGSICTVHANSCCDMISRLEMLVLMSSVPLPSEAIRRQIASGVDIMVHLGRLRDRSRRVLEISEVDGMENGEVRLNPLYIWNDENQKLERCGELKHQLKLERNAKN